MNRRITRSIAAALLTAGMFTAVTAPATTAGFVVADTGWGRK